MSDLVTMPLSMEAADHSMVAALLNQILAQSHPLLAEGLMLAAIPHTYDVPLFRALRAQPDERDEKMALRLAQFSFIRVVEPTDEAAPRYAVQSIERDILHRRWIELDPTTYTAAHGRALAFWQANPDPDPFTQVQTVLYHQLLVEPEAGTAFLLQTFRDYLDNRQLAALDRLIATATETYPYLAALGVPTANLDDSLAFLRARMAQARDQWQESLDTLATLRSKPTLMPALRPFVRRAYGVALTELGQYVEAIEELEGVLTLLRTMPGNDLEQGYTMIALGDAYRDMAVAARGYRTRFVTDGRPWQNQVQRVLGFPPLPLVAYLNWHGLRLWHPEVWAALRKQDWIIVRLLGSAARWYRHAERRLTEDARAQRPQAIIKLSQLYLTLGDARQTIRLCEELLADERFAAHDYRVSLARTGLGLAWLRRNEPEAAFRELEAVLPLLVAYEDTERAATVHEALGEAHLVAERYPEAVAHLTEALRLHLRSSDEVAATDVAERLDQVAVDHRVGQAEQQQAAQASAELTHRVYPLQFQHPFLITFHRASLVLLALLCFLVPMLAIRIDAQELMQLDIVFEAAPPLQADFGRQPLATELLVVESGYASGAVPHLVPVYALGAASWLLGGYVLIYLVLGGLLIARTRLSTVQATTREQAIRLDPEGITMGERGRGRSLPWNAIRSLSQLEVLLMGQPLLQTTETILATDQERMIVKGTMAWYPVLRERIAARVPPQAQRTLEVRRTLRGWMGGLYVLGVVSLLLFTLLYLLAPDLLNRPLGSMPYNVLGLYPYLYLALYIPPLWWGVIRPMIYLARTQRHVQLMGLAILGGVALALARLFLPHDWLVPPDIYPSLSILVLLGTSIAALWVAQRPTLPSNSLPEARQARPLLLALTLVLALVVGGAARHIANEVVAYHFLLMGNQALTDVSRLAEEGATGEAVRTRLVEAQQYYSYVLELDHTRVMALRGRGAATLQLGDFEAAIADFNQALTITDEPAEVYADRAIAHVSRGLALSQTEPEAVEIERQAALSDFGEAIRLEPERALFYVWRGTTHQAVGELDLALADYAEALTLEIDLVPALVNLGWLHFQVADEIGRAATDPTLSEEEREELLMLARDEYEQARASFEEAIANEEPDSDLLLALGYVQYRLEEWEAALATWSQVVEQDPTNAVALVSRGTARWRIAIEGDACSRSASAEENAVPAENLRAAIADLSKSLEFESDNDYTYRTIAQLHFGLRNCQPDHQFETEVRAAIRRYEEAVALDPDSVEYWLYLARVQTSLSLYLMGQPDRNPDALALLEPALLNINQARRLAPDDGEVLRWQRFIIVQTALMALTLGERDRAATLYNDWTALLPPAEQLRGATDNLSALIVDDPTMVPDELLALYRAMAAEVPNLVARNPGVEEAGGFWFTRSYFAFHLGRTLFFLGEEEPAAALLAEAVALAPRATALDPVNEFYPRWERFVRLGGRGWYYLRRGDLRFGEEDRPAALADFEAAARLIPTDDPITLLDATEAALKAGRAALLLGDLRLARQWYVEGIRRVTTSPTRDAAPLQAALDDLTDLPAATRARLEGLSDLQQLLVEALAALQEP